jgi:hypothetical protein
VNYSKIYSDLIESAKLRPNLPLLNGYTEKHHIIPRSMGGSNTKDNIVSLTAREHFVAHWLLWKIYRNDKMAFAFNMMLTSNLKQNRYCNSRAYSLARKAFSEKKKGFQFSQESRRKMSDSQKRTKRPSLKGKKLSEEHCLKLSEAAKKRKRKPLSEETRRKISEAHKGKKGQPMPDHVRKILKESAKQRRGVPLSEEVRAKISETKQKKKRGELPPRP